MENTLETSDFTAIVNTHSRQLFSRAFFITGDRPVAEDIVQETFLKLWQKREDLAAGELGGWLYTVVSRRAYHYRKKKARRMQITRALPSATWYTADMEERLDNKKRTASFSKIVRHLPRQQRLVYEMSQQASLSRAEIAARLNISPHTVKVHLRRAIQFIRDNITGVALFIFIFLFNNIVFHRSTTTNDPRGVYIYDLTNSQPFPQIQQYLGDQGH